VCVSARVAVASGPGRQSSAGKSICCCFCPVPALGLVRRGRAQTADWGVPETSDRCKLHLSDKDEGNEKQILNSKRNVLQAKYRSIGRTPKRCYSITSKPFITQNGCIRALAIDPLWSTNEPGRRNHEPHKPRRETIFSIRKNDRSRFSECGVKVKGANEINSRGPRVTREESCLCRLDPLTVTQHSGTTNKPSN
jgi:hypothetical protein